MRDFFHVLSKATGGLRIMKAALLLVALMLVPKAAQAVIEYQIDNVEGKCGSIYIKGWAYDSAYPDSACNVRITASEYIDYPSDTVTISTGVARPDVVDAHHGAGSYCGFEGYVPVTSGSLYVSIYITSTMTQANISLPNYTPCKVSVPYQVQFHRRLSGATDIPNTLDKRTGIPLTLPTQVPTLAGYAFLHWNSDYWGEGTVYNPGDEYTEDSKVTLYAQWAKAPVMTQCLFEQVNRSVHLEWNEAFSTYSNGRYVIYRNDEKIYVAPQSETSFDDVQGATATDFPYESEVRYRVWYVPGGMDENTRLAALGSQEMTADTHRHIYVNNLQSESHENEVVITWESFSYLKTYGHKFNIYVDNELVGTLTPTADNQTHFRVVHKSTSTHNDRRTKQEGATFYIEEPLDVCSPHNYTIRGVIDSVEVNQGLVQKLSVSAGTNIESFVASKAAYPSSVRLSWRVNQRGSSLNKLYIVEARDATRNDEVWEELWRSSNNEEYNTYTDTRCMPGVYYEYRLRVQDQCEEAKQSESSATDIGFVQMTGTVSGRVTFGSAGSAVPGVQVIARKANEETEGHQFYALRFLQQTGVLEWKYPKETGYAGKVFNNPFTIQLWVNVENLEKSSIIQMAGARLDMKADGTLLLYKDSTHTYDFTGVKLTARKYNHVALRRNGNVFTAYVIDNDQNGLPVVDSCTQTISGIDYSADTLLMLGGMKGYMDEFRLWRKALELDEILGNYDRILVGNEANLETYWTFDEGLASRSFDYSRSGSTYHEHHCVHGSDVSSVPYVPEEIGLKATTDLNGNYIIAGIPFSGNETNYDIIPTLGVHSFNPTQQFLTIGNGSLIHNGTDFNDISSFTVSGKVLYAGTDYPVEGCSFKVDGMPCSKDSKLITTDKSGEYTISVPIGEHFIQVEKDGHVFSKGGRYPEDPQNLGLHLAFNDAIANLTFYDSTLVNITGRVAGGAIEGSKAVGFGLSKNNIGVATLILTPQDRDAYRLNVVEVEEGTIINYQANPNTVGLASASPDTIHSKAWRGAGEKSNHLYIRTDPVTGEFSAMVPPLLYTLDSIYVASSGLDVLGNPLTVDLTNPRTEKKDSLEKTKNEWLYYTYHTKLMQTYRSAPQFSVVQSGHPDGSFGIDTIDIEDKLGKIKIRDIHHINADTVEYTYKYPLFNMGDKYLFEMKGYESYVNRDSTVEVVDQVPLAYTVVTIENALSVDQAVYGENNDASATPGSVYNLKSNQLQLDSLGEATYTWQGGLPNITSPYTRAINIYYEVDSTKYNWSGNSLYGIILGDMPTGNNFVTKGPDCVDMVLRDPPGSNSFSAWTTGTTTSSTSMATRHVDTDNTIKITTHGGAEVTSGVGVGVFVVNETKALLDVETGTHITKEWVKGNTYTKSVTATKTISTSDSPEYDGAEGDVFIGTSSNLIFGKVRNVSLYRNTDDTSKVHIDLQDAISTGLQFTTVFAYTQHYIENNLIPNLKMLRNACLTYAAKPDSVKPLPNRPIFATSRKPNASDYGAKGTYTLIPPSNPSVQYSDSINQYNQQIGKWQSHLWSNEYDKVRLWNNRSKLGKNVTNYSFDAGSTVNITVTHDTISEARNDTTWHWTSLFGGATGFGFNKVGFETEFHDESGKGWAYSSTSDTTHTATFQFTLKDSDPNDALTVDVYTNPDPYYYHSPIFRTRGGQTSNPYEGEVKTKYDQPGTVIMEATMQVEKPDLMVCGAKACMMTDVTSGTAANYTLRLANQSEVNADCNFKLLMVDATNPHGAQLFIDGAPLTDGRIITVPYGGEGVTKTLQLKQSDMSILDYDRIAVVLASVGQSDPTSNMPVIADTVYVSAHFVPSASPVALALNMSTMNTQTGTDLILTMKDFDRTYYRQKAFRLQYRQPGGDWTTFHEYVLHAEDLNGISELLPTQGASIAYTLPMEDYADGQYRFRIVSVSTFGTEEIYVYSNEMEVVKNLNRPRPLGQAEPTDGILDIGDELSITFNEEFRSGELNKTRNFLITGVLNGAPIEHHTALRLYENALAAQTEATVNLSKRDFSIDMWVNIHSNGLLLSHGTAKDLQVSTDAQGHLMIQIEGSTLISDAILPHDKWIFLTLSYRYETTQGLLSASVAYDDVTEPLFWNRPIAPYMDRGPIFIGGGAAGAIHELLLWDEAHDIAVALAQRSVTKNPATQHLIGYWKMNEGEGKTIRDYSRNRHMQTTDENWYINNINKAVTMDGAHHLATFTGDVPPMPTDDYAAELWFKAGKQNGAAQLFQLGEVGLYIDAIGKLHLQSGANDQIINHKFEILNNSWHHVLLNVHRMGTAAVYVDGERALTLSADKIGDLASDSLRIGIRRILVPATDSTLARYRYDRPFRGAVDEIRLWQATMPSDLMASNRKQRLRGDEPGLRLYYPFEKKELDEYNQVIVSGTMEEFTGHGEEAVISGQPSAISYSDEAPALKEKPTETNVAFSFTASNTKIVIDIDEDPVRIEGCMLNITVRDVRSNTGNYSLPATWTAFVHRNELAWTDNELSAKQENGEQTTLSTVLINRSGTPQRWTLSELPAWLTVNANSGMLNPMQQQSLAFRVSASAPIGKHELTVYAMGNNGIETPLTLHITITGDLPEWTINPADYENSMSIVAQLDFFGEISEDEDDIVAAFIDDECRGIAQPEYKERYDAYYLTMTIYGKLDDDGKDITFRAYDAGTGVLYTQVAASDSIRFKALSFVGSYKTPIVLSVQDRIEQRIALKQGWNWISLSVKADDMTPQAILRDIENDVIAIKGHYDKTQGIDVGFMTHTDTGWTGYMEPLLNRRSYMIKTKRDCELRIVGQSVDPATHRVRIHLNWGWPGYFGQQRIALADAFADADPQHGDIVRTQRAAAYYDDYEWVGSLQALEPGQGYAYYSVTNEEKWFAYPSSSVAAAPRRNAKIENEEDPVYAGRFAPDNEYGYPYNMILVGQVLLDNEPAANVEIGIFDGDECRSVGYTDEQGRLLMLVAGEDEAILAYKMVLHDQVFETVETLNYLTDDIVGSPDSPHLIRFGKGQGIGNVQGDDVQCTKVLRDGILFIERNGRIYTSTGAQVK